MTYTITRTPDNLYTVTNSNGSTLAMPNFWAIAAAMGFGFHNYNGLAVYEFGNPVKWNGLYRVNELKG